MTASKRARQVGIGAAGLAVRHVHLEELAGLGALDGLGPATEDRDLHIHAFVLAQAEMGVERTAALVAVMGGDGAPGDRLTAS